MASRCSCRQNLNWKTLNDDVLSFLYRAMFAQKCDLRLERDDRSIRVGGGKEDEDVQVERHDRLRVEEGSHRSPDGIAVQKASGDHLVQQADRGFHQTAFRTTDYAGREPVPGCVSAGRTLDEAVGMAREALAGASPRPSASGSRG